MSAARTLIVMAKEPRPGLAKTRLAAGIGEDAAAQLAEAMVLDALDLAGDPRWRTLVAHAPPDAGPWFAARAPEVELWPQPEGDLGDRMGAAFRAALAAGAGRCVMVGTDAPLLGRDAVATAFDALEGRDVCLAPTEDGGYALIGVRADHPALFEDVPWSTDGVARITTDRCRAEGLGLALLPETFDVDEAGDVDRLAAELVDRAGIAPRTRAALAALGRLG